MTRTPGAPTHPAGEGRRRTLPQARGSPTSSGRRNQTASSRPRRRGAPESPRTSRRGRCWMSPAPRPSGPTGLPSAPEGPGRPPPGNPAPREPRSRSPWARVHHDRPPAGAVLPRDGTYDEIKSVLCKNGAQPRPSMHPEGHRGPREWTNSARPAKLERPRDPNQSVLATSNQQRQAQEKRSGNGKSDHGSRRPTGADVRGPRGHGGTGSTFTAVPREPLRRLGVPVLRSAQSELADGSDAPVEIGRTVIRLEGQEFHTPVIFAEEGEPSLLGVVTLEAALLAVDPVAGRLAPANVLRL